jgi:hypothetical protein
MLIVCLLSLSLQWFRKQSYYPLHSTSPNDVPPVIRLLAGSMAGLTSVFFTYPLDYVHSRLTYQVKRTRYKGIADTIRLTREEAGIRGLYRQCPLQPLDATPATVRRLMLILF